MRFLVALVISFPLFALPHHFEPNRGQFPAAVLFRSGGVSFTAHAAQFGPIRMELAGTPEVSSPQPGRSNYLLGSRRIAGVPQFAELRFRGAYRGADLIFYRGPSGLEYDFRLSPGADPTAIRLRFNAPAAIENGELVVRSGGAVLRHHRPIAYQEIAGQRRYVDAQYRLTPRGAAFDLAPYDQTLPLVIDPVLTFATYLGGSGADTATAVAQDASGNIVVAGSSELTLISGYVAKLSRDGSNLISSTYIAATSDAIITAMRIDSGGNIVVTGYTDLPGSMTPTAGAYQTAGATGFVTKLNPAGDRILFTSVFAAAPAALAIDPAGNIYIAGSAGANFQTTSGVIQPANRGGSDAFILKLNPDGSRALYATLLGGSNQDGARAIAVDTAGQAYITGDTASSNFPITPGAAQSAFAGLIQFFPAVYGDAFVAKLDPAGANLIYSTFFGGAVADVAYAIVADSGGNAYVAGSTQSVNFPITAGAFQPRYAGSSTTDPDPAGDAFAAKFAPQGALVWSTYLGGASREIAAAIVLDAAGNSYIAGTTESSDFPHTAGAIPDCHTGARPFLAQLDPTGAQLVRSTGTSGLSLDQANALALDASGAILLAGESTSRVFLPTPAAAQKTFGGGDSDAWIARIDLAAAPKLHVACVLNGASFLAGNSGFFPTGTVAPGEIVSIFGSALTGAQVFFDGRPAPVLYTSATQINAVVPYAAKAPLTQLTVQRAAESYGPVSMPVTGSVPAIFTVLGSGTLQAAVINQDGTLNSIENPAPRGTVIAFYATGAGLMIPAVADGTVSPLTLPLPVPELPVSVTIRGVRARVVYVGTAPGYVSGLMQVNVEIPQSIDFGNSVPLLLTIGQATSQFNVTIAVK